MRSLLLSLLTFLLFINNNELVSVYRASSNLEKAIAILENYPLIDG